MRVSVTQKDIDEGMPSAPSSCPIALALKRQIPELQSLVVDEASVRMRFLDNPLYAEDYWLPIEAIQFIAEFDKSGAVEPFTFELEIAHEEEDY